MSFSSYPTYKDSNIEWLSSIPVDWQFSKLKFVTTCNDEVLPENFDPEEEINYIEISDVSLNLGVTNLSTLAFGAAPSRARRVVRHGDILISTVRTYLKAIAQVTYPEPKTIASTGFAVIRPKESYSTSGFLKYLAHAEGFIGEVISRSTGVSYPAINASELISIDLPLPPINEQNQIARFLDHEVGKIDALIAEQEKLIALLKEKRQAIISHAVTKGLNPDVPMKDSGVEWLGQVPEHWDVIKLGYLTTKIGSGKTPSGGADIYQDDGIPLIRSQNVYDDGLRLDDVVFISDEIDEELRTSRVKPHDILLNITGGSIGRSCLVPDNIGRANVNQHVCIIRLLQPHLSINQWVAYFFKSIVIKEQINQCQNGAAREGLNFEQISGFRICVPPETEILNTLNYIEKIDFAYRSLDAEASMSISLLQERRSALISAAVTGKIDVRGWQAPEENVNPANKEVCVD